MIMMMMMLCCGGNGGGGWWWNVMHIPSTLAHCAVISSQLDPSAMNVWRIPVIITLAT